MPSIREQIIAARKAKGLTQEGLAKALNVSRAAVSNWETGRRIPDAEMLLKLSRLLNYSFEECTQMAPEAAPDGSDTPVETENLPRDGAARRGKRLWIILGAAAAVIALCAALLVPALKSKPQEVLPADGAITKAFFQQDNSNREGQPFLNIESVLKTQKNDGIDMWLYTLSFHEMNGFPFAIDQLEAHTFVGDRVHSVEVTRDNIAAQGLATDIPAHGDWSLSGGMPVQDSVSGIGFVLRGTDESGAEQSFVFYQPLSAQ